MPRVGFEPTISAGERPKTYALDRAATGTGNLIIFYLQFVSQRDIFSSHYARAFLSLFVYLI